MKQNLKCPLCYEIIYSEVGKGCKMCGMALIDKSKSFCCDKCRRTYSKINIFAGLNYRR